MEFGLIKLTAVRNRQNEQKKKEPDNLGALEGVYEQARKTYVPPFHGPGITRREACVRVRDPFKIVRVVGQFHEGSDRENENRKKQTQAANSGGPAI